MESSSHPTDAVFCAIQDTALSGLGPKLSRAEIQSTLELIASIAGYQSDVRTSEERRAVHDRLTDG